MAEILVEQGSLARADILRIANVLDENEPGLSATVAYLRSEVLEEHHARTETATSSARGLSESMDSVERFRIVRPHARGGLGEVFLAVDAELDRQVALKELQAYHAHDPHSQARFLREARVTGRLEHPGIVPVYGLGRHADGRPYYAMRFIEGETLKQRDRTVSRSAWCTTGNRRAGARVPAAVAQLHRRLQRGRLRAQPGRRAPGPEAREHHARTIRRDAGR